VAFKIAISAGHCLTTAGKRLPKKLDPKQTREWVLNDRIARYLEEAAAQYDGVEILRLDNRDGSKGNDNTKRAKKANDWGADFLIDIHHNAGINLGKGGGIVAFCYKKNTTAEKYRDAIYAACIAAGGLKGNRATPKKTNAYTILKKAKAPAVLMEYGFMDSKTDAPVILTEAYAKLVGYATMEGIVKIAGLKKQTATTEVCKVELKVLGNGDKGDQVKAMQILLEAYGCKGKMDSKKYGSFGSNTEAAVKSYQKKVGLPQTGKCDEKTWKELLGA
jgi:N-acetylmuramoyl-L-alanine amidase